MLNRLFVDAFIRWVEDGIEWFRFDFCQQPMDKSNKHPV
jgi:hypothetical protein